MKVSTRTLVATLLVLSTAAANNCYCAGQVDSRFKDELSAQEKIYQSDDESLRGSYVVDRTLQNYARMLAPGFDDALAKLGPRDRWLDIGAGMGFAILDYYNPNYDLLHPERNGHRKKAQAVAISIENRKHLGWQVTAARLEPNQIR
jgi:hypothetical protein